MKKVLIVFNHPAPYKVRLFNEIAKKMDLTVIFERKINKDRSKTFYFENDYHFKNIFVKGLKVGNENLISNGIKKHLKHNKYDLVIMNGYSSFAEMTAIRYLQKQGIPYALFINGGIISINESKFKRNLKKSFISKAIYYLSPDEESNRYLEFYGAKPSNIYNYCYSTFYDNEIIPEPLTKSEKETLRVACGMRGDRIFVSAGQLIKRKNYQTLIKEWKNMPGGDHLYIYGDGKEYLADEQLIQDLELENVHLHKFLPKAELFKRIRCSDYFIFPSNEDIYGHVINESMSQGVPCISNLNVNSAKKLIIEGKNGFVTTNFNASTILHFADQLDDPQVALNCLNTAHENTIEKMSQQIADIILKH